MAFDGVMHLLIMEQENNIRQRHEIRIMQRNIRDASNPFNYPNKTFLKLFRLSKHCCIHLIENLEPHMVEAQRVTKIPVHLKILTALHFFGHGSYQMSVGHGYSFGFSQPAVSRCISEVTDVITNYLLPQHIQFPNSDETRLEKKRGFRIIDENFQDLIGVIDCTHIRIVAPPAEHPVHPGAPYYCRKHFYAINTQIICDADRKIININARFPGSVHDSAIWMMSQAKPVLQQKYIESGQLNYVIGDSGYPLEPWLLTPFVHVVPNSPESRYNRALTNVRTIIEHVNGLLKGRFRCTHGHRALHYDPVRAAKIIYSCAVLHNITRTYNVPMPQDDNPLPPGPRINNPIDGNLNEHGWFNEATRVRQNLINLHFVNEN